MSAVLGNLIVIAILGVGVFFCGRNVIRMIRSELSGGSCSGCAGCASAAGCTSCASPDRSAARSGAK